VDDRYVLAGSLPPLAIPSTLHASLLARLDRLSAVKDMAQIGAAIGREFSFGLTANVSGIPEQELAAALAKLVAAELIFQRGVPPDATYRFKHTLVQDAAYASLLRGRRRALHAAIVKELIAGGVGGTEVAPEVLAQHFAEAGMAAPCARLNSRISSATDCASRSSERKLWNANLPRAILRTNSGCRPRRSQRSRAREYAFSAAKKPFRARRTAPRAHCTSSSLRSRAEPAGSWATCPSALSSITPASASAERATDCSEASR
jgi:hypothetical protein